MEDIKIIYHNVLKWTSTRANELYNIYRIYDPDLILLNSPGKKQEEKIKIFGYKVYQKNYYNENSAGIAVAIKSNITHKIIDHYNGDILGMELETSKGRITVATAYVQLPPFITTPVSGGFGEMLQHCVCLLVVKDSEWTQLTLGIVSIIRTLCKHNCPYRNASVSLINTNKADTRKYKIKQASSFV